MLDIKKNSPRLFLFFFVYLCFFSQVQADLYNCQPHFCHPGCGGSCPFFECTTSLNTSTKFFDHLPFHFTVSEEPNCNSGGNDQTIYKLPANFPINTYGGTVLVNIIPYTTVPTQYKYCVPRTETWYHGWTITASGSCGGGCAYGGEGGGTAFITAQCDFSTSSPQGTDSGICCQGPDPSYSRSCSGCAPPPPPPPPPVPAGP